MNLSSTYASSSAMTEDMLLAQASALMDGVSHPIANLANLAALLWQSMPEINWCGFYLIDHGVLTLGPFCGLPACIEIPLSRGVCGTAAVSDCVRRVPNVHEFPGHIACDSASNSEIVLPIHFYGRVIGVLDIDSPKLARFDDADEAVLRKLVQCIESTCDFSQTGYSLS